MTTPRVTPKLYAPSSGKAIRRSMPQKLVQQTGPIFNRLTVVWVQFDGVPFNTTGFFARLIRNNRVVATASFDRFGVVRFNQIQTLTNVSYTIRTYNANGLQYRSRRIPARVATFAIIG